MRLFVLSGAVRRQVESCRAIAAELEKLEKLNRFSVAAVSSSELII